MVTEPAIPTEQLSRQLHQMLLPIVRIIEDPNGSQDPQLGKRLVILLAGDAY